MKGVAENNLERCEECGRPEEKLTQCVKCKYFFCPDCITDNERGEYFCFLCYEEASTLH